LISCEYTVGVAAAGAAAPKEAAAMPVAAKIVRIIFLAASLAAHDVCDVYFKML
jgi:hypothetical protein